jgi:hypothetical protein
MIKKIVLLALVFGNLLSIDVFSQVHKYYQEPTWQPRAILPYADAINNDFWPASPSVEVNYSDPSFDTTKLAKVPAIGVYPRVLITPTDVEKIRAKVALGDKAPIAFKTMWQRVINSQSPFYALVTKDEVLGKKLAQELVQKIKALDAKVDLMDKRPDRDNLWSVERSIVASGDPDPPTEIWDLLNYDYLHDWMSNEEQELARAVIAKIVKNRISNFLMVPDHFMINNHEGFGMEYLRLMLLIEGQKGFDQKLFDLAVHKADAMLSWYLDKDGMCYESIKGWLNVSAFVAVGLRHPEILKHSNLMAKMRFFQAAIRWEDGEWHIRDEMRASAFHVIWMMHYYHPTNEGIDFLYQSTFSTHPFLTDATVKWPNPVGICNELLLLYADNGIINKEGKTIDWTLQSNINKLNLPTTWQDNLRGYVEVRNSWKKEDLHVGFVCKQDFLYGGHEGSENNRLTLWKDGVNWIQDNNMLATKATFLQNMLTVDGMGCHWPPVGGNWLGIQESKEGLIAVGDGKMGYSFSKSMQIHPLAFPSTKIPYYSSFMEGNYDLSRDIQIAFQPATLKWNDGYAHTDYGPWSGETRLVEGYKPFNTMKQAYRTIQVAKGNYPYVLVIDDAQKDHQIHNFDWNISVPIDAELVEAVTPEIVFQNTDPSAVRMDDIILAKGGTARDVKTGKIQLKKGDPLCLIRVLWRNTAYGFPVPKFEKFQGYSLVTVPARSISPEYKILVYPYQYGDPLPVTTWNKDRTTLAVTIKDQKDIYNFATTDGGRTVVSMKRNNSFALSSNSRPEKPELLVRNERFNQNDLRYTRNENKIPTYFIDESLKVQFIHSVAPAQIRFTIDGSEPTATSAVYTKPILITKNTTLKAITYNAEWVAGETKSSEVLKANFIVKKAAIGLPQAPANSKNGLTVKVYEINTKLYNNKGFFEASKIMMPDVSKYSPTYQGFMNQFVLPLITPKQPIEQQSKGFYQYTGWFFAKEKGVFTFDVNSCGPVLLDVAEQSVIEEIGVFHQQQDHRKGEVVLNKGWHPIQLVVCDPLFWNSNSLDKMAFEVSYQINGGVSEIVNSSELKSIATTTQSPKEVPTLWHEALLNVPNLEIGLVREVYDRTGKRRDPDFLDVDTCLPMYVEQVDAMEPSNSRNTVRVYNGYYFAPSTGSYQFQLPIRSGANSVLGSLQASCQNQLRIDDTIILQKGVYGRNLSGIALLKEGWHRISLRFGTGEASCKVQLPEGQTIDLKGNNLSRPSLVSVVTDGIQSNKNWNEIYEPTKVKLIYTQDAAAKIYYTLDGSNPTNKSLWYKGEFIIAESKKVKALAFKNNVVLSAPTIFDFKLVAEPELGSLGRANFDNWDGKTALYNTDTKYKIWISPRSQSVKGRLGKGLELQPTQALISQGVDVNVQRGTGTKPGFKLYDIQMRENALTVALWFKTDSFNGNLFGKEGYNAYGKAYRTFSCNLQNGKLVAMPNRLRGGKIILNEWQYVVLTGNENQMALYLNGELVASDIGSKEIATDALDFFTTNHAIVDNVQLFDRLLDAKEVKKLYDQKKTINNK